ncbi:DUF5817 domain-containing protein [Halorubrum vacuolatum]|uniref:Ribosomal protein L31 n=1 Tax=Halorubrum vacuolatum TaxID=63740 RepID=A0A238UN79_HALVU|nr:DUF5817 domain-containing protein [Halorubrum vacuolatum]SNR23381.1 Ribosomal protein L31 [Halorubrum vacuolatum]
MYAVVGCTDCGNVWLLRDRRANETARCPRCGRTHQTAKLNAFYTSEDREEAREARAALLARKRGESETFAEVAHVADLEVAIEDSGVDDREYLEASGLDADAVFEAGAAATEGGSTSRSRDEIVRDAVREAEEPTEAGIVGYATDHGVPEEAARDLLAKLTRRGDLSESGGRYRVL